MESERNFNENKGWKNSTLELSELKSEVLKNLCRLDHKKNFVTDKIKI